MNEREKEIFMIRATRCARCGGILMSEYGLKHGMGHTCKQKYDMEHQSPDPNQVTFFETEERFYGEDFSKND